MIRQRVAPTDARIEISRDRPAARASSRLATLAQAMSRTNSAVAMTMSGPGAVSRRPTCCSPNLTAVAWTPVLVCGYSRDCCAAIAASSALPSSAPTPSASRPKTSSVRASRGCPVRAGIEASGCHSVCRNGNPNPSGMTPITTAGTPATFTVRPTAFISAP